MTERYLIGIDLGTTNSALAYIDLERAKNQAPKIESFPVAQLIAKGEMGERELLPSFLYLPGPHDLPAGSTALPWDAECDYVVGEFARNHGSRIPGRLASSAKSWLCHAGVDRSEPLLPWSAPPEVERISPVEASTRYIQHFRDAWNHAHPKYALEKQNVVLTVPASFDDMARTLTVEAAEKAGLEHVTLLEEPQAAFYCWLATHSAKEAAQLKPGYVCVVVDVGGGTSDFSLIQAVEQKGELGFVRQAVGDHLLLGGDNMDLALAKSVESRLSGAGKIDAAQFGTLVQACREAKEMLLGENPPDSHTVTVMGRGRKVVGGTVTANLHPEHLRQVIVDGFFPIVDQHAEPKKATRVGLHEMGLPYVSDPAVTRHIADFLKHHLPKDADGPHAILFNGGVFQPAALRERVVEVMRNWYGESWQPLLLTNASLNLAVARGAAHYGWLKHTGGQRIGGGIARSYYVAVESQGEGLESPGTELTVVCVVPQHLEEGEEVRLEKPELELALGQPVLFPLYTSTVRGDDKAGDLLSVAPDQLLQLPPLHTVLRGGKRSGTKRVPVTLAARCTEIGTLELFCVAIEGENRWRLEFNVRDIVKGPSTDGEPTERQQTVTDVWPEELVQKAGELIIATYEERDGAPKTSKLTKEMEAALDASRGNWPTGLCRRLWDFLADVIEHRRRSPGHLSRWNNLAGFCLRPGFGDPLDKFRVEQLWKMLHAPVQAQAKHRVKKQAPKIIEGGADYWIMWRRVAGGLNSSRQRELYNRAKPVLLPSKSKNIPKPPVNELTEMWRAIASMERLDIKQKETLGDTLLKSLRRSPTPPHGFFGLTRLGARVLFYGPLNSVVHRESAEKWINAVIDFSPGNDSERNAWAFCLSQLARRSGQRALDVDDTIRDRVLDALRGQSIPEHWIQMVEEVTELVGDEQSQMFGESLPIGLRLIGD